MWLLLQHRPLILHDCEDHSKLAHFLQKVWQCLQPLHQAGEDVLGQASLTPLQILPLLDDHVPLCCLLPHTRCLPEDS